MSTSGAQNRSTRGRICIVGGTHLANTPRIVKEADALFDAGFDVRVIFSQRENGEKCTQDAMLIESRRWRATAIRWSRRENTLRWAVTGIRQKAFQRFPRPLWSRARIVERAEGRVFPELASVAASEPADLYIGHYVDGLAAAAAAAKRWRTAYGFDAEDFHVGEGHSEAQTRRVDFIHRQYLLGCSHISAASSGIAEALSSRYGIEAPVAIHNAFPWADRRAIDERIVDRRGPELSLYWYSQTIGLDRGLQDAIHAAGLLGGPVQIHLRGTLTESVRTELVRLAHECGVADRLVFHAQVSPEELLSRACEHDVGLALEQGTPVNRALCGTNKMFLYLLAGLSVVATDVPGQRSILSQVGPAAKFYTPGDYQTLAGHLEHWRVNRAALMEAKAAALHSARTTWNWESESSKLVAAVSSTLERCVLAPPAVAMS